MDEYVQLCSSFGLPMWIAPLIHRARRLRSDPARRKRVYRLIRRTLMFHKLGVKEGSVRQPTYVYPGEVKLLIRSVFPRHVCDFPDPSHDRVVYVTTEDLHKVMI
ncbi:hypothetical protein JOB18_021879 [Solea senegalensis]|uniref:Uncharacterized protein n=1 Tax=Solea senegalensis TaxID=28829 RepID=A0AAV6T6B2_SOLSE|nr:hypothetical protein JOB18_021879 [Solea senegalensis]